MALELSITARGQVTLRRALLEHRGVKQGDKVGVALLPHGKVELTHAASGHEIARLGGMLRRAAAKPVSLDAMREAIATGRMR